MRAMRAVLAAWDVVLVVEVIERWFTIGVGDSLAKEKD
jgi:hypothetical protein